MTAEVLSQLKALRGGLADHVQGDPRYLTLNALDKSVAEIGTLAAAPGEAGAVPTQVLGQIKTIRDGIADGLRNDHRYLTLTTLDKSIAEIGGLLAAAGVIAPEHAAPMAPVHLGPGAPVPPPPAAAAPAAAPAAPAEAPSKLKPILETAAVIAAGVAAVEMIGGHAKPAAAATSAPKAAAASAEAEKDDEPETDAAEAHDEPSEDHAEAEHAAEDSDAEEDSDDGEPSDDDEAVKAESADDEDQKDEDGDKADDEETVSAETEADAAEGDDADDPKAAKDEDDETDASDDADPKASDDDEAAGDEADAEEETPAKGDAAEDADTPAKHARKKPDGDDDEMPDAADVVPKGKASGYVPMAAKAGAVQYQPGVSVKFGKLPNKVDLRSLMTPIEDQGDTSSCVANAVAGAYEYWVKKASKQDTNISRLFIYYNARWRDGSQDKDDGSVIQLAMEGLQKFGACPETVWPFDPRLVLKKPGGEAYKDAAPNRVQDMAQVPLKLDAWKQALAEGKPIIFGIALFDSFDECSKRGGVVPMPSPEDVARAKHSGHSMCAVGYSDTEKVFIVRNSWGADWGDKGYCYMPYDYLLNEKFNDGDCWVFVPKVPQQPPREVWSNTTEPVTNGGQGVDFPITTHTIADYANIAVDLFEHVRKPFNGTLVADYSQYVTLASQSLWSEFESFDFTTFLASTAALAGVSSLALESLSETSEHSETSESSEVSESSESLESSEESEESDESSEESDESESDEESDSSDDDADEDDSEDSEDDDDESDDDDSESDEADDDDSDDGSDDDADGDEDGDDDSDGDGDGDESDEDGDESDEDSDDESDDDGDSDGDGESEDDDDDDSDEDDSDEDDGGDDDGGDEGGDEGGGDEGGDDDE